MKMKGLIRIKEHYEEHTGTMTEMFDSLSIEDLSMIKELCKTGEENIEIDRQLLATDLYGCRKDVYSVWLNKDV